MLEKLRIKGFRRFVDETFEFGPGVTFIDGKNNAGKTTLFLAIEYALTGTVAGARSQAMLLHPDAKGMGVEIVFTGRGGKRYKLQRVHQLPPRSRSKLVGHFTLKQVGEGGDESYLLASDFQDHEDALAKKLHEITGVSRRVLDLAVHIRQGEIATILDGDPKLDIVLGITAAGTANEEMRTLALADEEAASALPALEASLAHLENERRVAASDEGELHDKVAKLVAESRALELAASKDDDREAAKDAELARLAGAIRAWRSARDVDASFGDRAKLEAQVAALEDQVAALAARADETELRYDLRARIKRREATLQDPTCEHCGSAIDTELATIELTTWKLELENLEAESVDESAIRGKLASTTQRLHDGQRASRAVAIAETAARKLAGEGDLEAIEKARVAARQNERIARAADRARIEAKIESLGGAIDEIEARVASHSKRGADLEREHARVAEAVERLRQRRRRGEDFRRLASAFKQLQEELRTRAATELSERLFEIHKQLGVDHDVLAVTIDPTRYQVLVTPKSTGVPMPAVLAQGGGHRLLLGLAFRLALVERLGPFPFVLLDEPTYGLDARHRLALLDRIAKLGLAEQILVITHQDMGAAQGARISIDERAA